MSRENRRGYEFSKNTKDAEFNNWHKKNPGREDAEIQVHHILPISDAKRLDVPKQAVRSRQNAVAVDKDFHNEIHQELDEETKQTLAQAFIGMWKKLI